MLFPSISFLFYFIFCRCFSLSALGLQRDPLFYPLVKLRTSETTSHPARAVAEPLPEQCVKIRGIEKSGLPGDLGNGTGTPPSWLEA